MSVLSPAVEHPKYPAAARLSLRKRLLFTAIVFIVFLLLAELSFRLVYPLVGGSAANLSRARQNFLERPGTCYEEWPYTMYRWSDMPGTPYRGSFASTHEVTKERARSTIRIAFIGGSTTHSGNTDMYLGSFPYFVERFLSRAHLPVEVLNCGVPAWTSAENLVHYELDVQDYSPDWVVIHQGVNDVKPRLYEQFRSDYGHFRRPFVLHRASAFSAYFVMHSDLIAWVLWKTGVTPMDLAAVTDQPLKPGPWELAPEGAAAFRRNEENLVYLAQKGGARVLLTTESHNRRPKEGKEVTDILRRGVDEHNEITRAIARERSIPLVDLEAELDYHGPLFLDYVHLKPKGNKIKARLVAKALLDEGLKDDPRFHLEPRPAGPGKKNKTKQ